MSRLFVLCAFVTCLGLSACGSDNPCDTTDPSCTFEGCASDGDCTGDQVCYERNASGYGVRCEKDCDTAKSYCAAPPAG